jgi:hypothetical protein
MLALISWVIFGGRGEPGGYLSRMGRIAGKIRPIQTRLSLTINPSLFELLKASRKAFKSRDLFDGNRQVNRNDNEKACN